MQNSGFSQMKKEKKNKNINKILRKGAKYFWWLCIFL